MGMRRRDFLQGALVGGALVPVSGAHGVLQAAATTNAPAATKVPLLVAGATAPEQAFAAGVTAAVRNVWGRAPQHIDLGALVLTDYAALRDRLEGLRGRRLVGVLDDSRYAVFIHLVRELGSSELCYGQHRWGGPGAYASRHALRTAADFRGIGGVLAGALVPLGYSVEVIEHAVPAVAHSGGLGAATGPASDWAEVVGQVLARFTMGVAGGGSPGHYRLPGDEARGPRQSLVSFALDV